ncbi:MFS transporter [Jatrophihabitans sp. DSM 45814]
MYLTLRDRPLRDRTKTVRERVAGTVILLGIVSMFTDMATESVNAILPKYLIVVVGLSPQAFGFVNGLYNGISAVIRIFGGWISDRTDHPKWVAFVGYFGSAIARTGLLFATGLGAISTIITADRLGKGLRTAPRDALIAAASPPESLGRAYGVHRSLDSVGAAIGPLIAFWILTVVENDFHAVFVASSALSIVGVAILVLIVPDLRPRRARANRGAKVGKTSRDTDVPAAAVSAKAPFVKTAKPGRVTLAHLANPYMARLLTAATMLGLLTVGDAFLYLQLQLRDNLANNYYALLMVGMNVAYLCLAIPLGRLADRVGRARIFIGGHVALLFCYLCAAGPFAGPAMSIGTLILLGTYYAATDGTLAALSGRIVDPDVRTSGIATAQTFMAIAGFGSSLVVGVLWARLGLGTAILWYCPVLLVAIPVAAFILLRLDRESGARVGLTV